PLFYQSSVSGPTDAVLRLFFHHTTNAFRANCPADGIMPVADTIRTPREHQVADSESTEMYLKSILELDGAEEPVAIARIAERVGVSAVSANEMVKRLIERDFVVHTPYKGVELTAAGL